MKKENPTWNFYFLKICVGAHRGHRCHGDSCSFETLHVLGTGWDPLEELYMLLTAEPFPQALLVFFNQITQVDCLSFVSLNILPMREQLPVLLIIPYLFFSSCFAILIYWQDLIAQSEVGYVAQAGPEPAILLPQLILKYLSICMAWSKGTCCQT